jgi:REP element-mobilizing transposase RayT
MPRPPKFYFPGKIYYITTSVEEGFMFPPNELTREYILKSLAQAQTRHKIEIVDIIVQPTHIHIMVRVLDPTDAAKFMERFKTETAHVVNRILGRKKKTVWCEGYDSPLIPDLATAIDRIAYIYANPSNDNGEDTIEAFPGFNTFSSRKWMASGELPLDDIEVTTYHLARSDFIPVMDHTPEGYNRYRLNLVQNKKKNTVTFSPNALFKAFGITDEKEIRQLNAFIVAEVRKREEKNRSLREAAGRTVIGAKKLRETPIGTHYVPNRKGRRMRVHCKDVKLRKEVLADLRAMVEKRDEVRELRRKGDYSRRYPIGMFPPYEFRLAEYIRTPW